MYSHPFITLRQASYRQEEIRKAAERHRAYARSGAPGRTSAAGALRTAASRLRRLGRHAGAEGLRPSLGP